MNKQHYPRVHTVFEGMREHPSSLLYAPLIRSSLLRLYPHALFFAPVDEDKRDESLADFHASLPLLRGTKENNSLSLFLLCRHRPDVGKFFFDILSRWLVATRNVRVGLFFTADFTLPEIDEETYTLSEICLVAEEEQEIEMFLSHLPMIESEVLLGVSSLYHATKILEIKGMSGDEKSSLVQERITSLVQKRPADFDYDIFGQMQHFFLACREEFKLAREYEQMMRIICIFYLFRKQLRDQAEAFPEKRHINVRISRARIHLPLEVKEVLGIFVGMNFLKAHEVFEERHLLKAIKGSLPEIEGIEGSFLIDENREDNIRTFYVEVEKRGEFSSEEINKLRQGLLEDVKGSVEQLVLPLFMPRNEEEVMRNIITLSQQLKFVRDLPQVIISFNEQTNENLSFTVILARILQPESVSIETLFQRTKSSLEFFPDRIKKVGTIRNKYPKEATVFKVHLSNKGFLREDYSVDLYSARQVIAKELQEILGEFRDFNGGMIAKQVEAFSGLKEALGAIGNEHKFFLENFFHSLFPVEARSVVSAAPLKTLFLMLLESSHREERALITKEVEGVLYLLTLLKDPSAKLKILQAVAELELRSSQLVSLDLKAGEKECLGYICFSEDPQKRERLVTLLTF